VHIVCRGRHARLYLRRIIELGMVHLTAMTHHRKHSNPKTGSFTLTRRELLQSALLAAWPGIGGLTASPNVALTMAQFLNRIRFTDLPPKAIEHSRMIIASTLASAAPGSLIDSARIVRELAKEQGGKAEASIWFDGAKLPMNEAARVNAMLSDAAASDDSDLRNVAHTGTTVCATGLAVGERVGATGEDLLAAIVTGYEAAGRIGEALGDNRQGFHASVIVAFGGTVTAGRLLKLTDAQMAHAIGLTATTMGGLGIGTNSWAREYHAGNAALCAVNAALAGGRGFTANEDMLEAPRGFLAVFGGGKADTQRLTADLGKEWDVVTHMAVKLVPGAHAFHPSVEAAVNAARQSGAPPEEVTRILVSGPQTRTIGRGRPPKDLIEAIHSLHYFLASAVADKDFSWIHATPQKIHSPAVARLIGLIEADPSPPSVRYNWSWGGTVTIVTNSGARYTSTVDAPRASGPRGIEWKDVDAKYRALLPDSGLPAKRIEETLNMIHTFERVKNVSELTRLLRR
jgi:2-methylcitrate dehydratase PrpD